MSQQNQPNSYEKVIIQKNSSQQAQQQVRNDSQNVNNNININNLNDCGSARDLQNLFQSNNQQSISTYQSSHQNNHQIQQQMQGINQPSGSLSSRNNSIASQNNNKIGNNNNLQLKGIDNISNNNLNNPSQVQSSGVNGNNYKVAKTFQKNDSENGSVSATNFTSQNQTQTSRKKSQIEQQQSQQQSQQQMAALESQEMANIREQCIFCQKFNAYHSFGPLLNKALYSKYSSSQNYFYSKDINDILANAQTQLVVRYRDIETFDEEEEYLKRFYLKSQIPMKMRDLTEYYKYHKDIPRLFMLSIGNVMNRYHDKRRRIEYQRIKKQLNFETSNNNNTEESQVNSEEEEEDSQGNKTAKKKEIPKECSNMLQELDVTLSFHQRMEVKIKSTQNLGKEGQNSQKIAPHSDINAFYINQQPNKAYLHQQKNQIHQFDMSSMMKKSSNKNFFAAQIAAGNNLEQRKNQLQYNYYNNNENETSYQLSRILQSFQQNDAEKYFYSTEMSISNLNSILYTQTNDISNLSNVIYPSSTKEQQPNRNHNIQTTTNGKLIPTLNFQKNKIGNYGSIQNEENIINSNNNKQKLQGENSNLNQKAQINNNQQSQSSGSNFQNLQQYQGVSSNPFQDIHVNLPSQKLSNIILEQQNKIQKAILNNGNQLNSNNNLDNQQKQLNLQTQQQQKQPQQQISFSQSSSNSLVKTNQLNPNVNKISNTAVNQKEVSSTSDKQQSSSSSNSLQQKQFISAKQIMKVLTQNQQNNTAVNTPAATVTTSPQSSLIEKDLSKINIQQQQILEQHKINPSNTSNNNISHTGNVNRVNSNQSISQKILQKRASENIYSSVSNNPLISQSTKITSTQKNSSLIGGNNGGIQPFYSTNINQNNQNILQNKIEIDTKNPNIERRFQTTERERIFSERKDQIDKFSFSNANCKKTEKSSPTHPKQQQQLQLQSPQQQIFQFAQQKQTKEQNVQQVSQKISSQMIDTSQFKQSQQITPTQQPANTSRPRSSLHQGQNTYLTSQSAQKQPVKKSQSMSNNPLFQTLRQSNLQVGNNSTKIDSIPSSSALNHQPQQIQQQFGINNQFLTSQNSQSNLQQSQFQVISDSSISPQLYIPQQQTQLHLTDLQQNYHYSSPINTNTDKLQQQLNSNNNNNGDMRIKKRKESQNSLTMKGNSGNGMSAIIGSSNNINSSQISQPNVSQQSQQILQQQRNNLKSQNSSQKKIKYSQNQIPQLGLQTHIQGQMIDNQIISDSVPTSIQSSAQASKTNFFNQKRNSQTSSLNPDLIKTQFYKTSNAYGTVGLQQKNRSSSNPKLQKVQNNNLNTNAQVNVPKSQNFILQYDTNFQSPVMMQSQSQSQLSSSLLQQQLSHQQQQQQLLLQQQQQIGQLGVNKHQKSNSMLHQPSNQFLKQSSASTHNNFNPNNINPTQHNPLSGASVAPLPLNLNLPLNQIQNQNFGIQSLPNSAKIASNINNLNNLSNNISGNNSQGNFQQINLQLVKNYSTGNTNYVSQNNSNNYDGVNNVNFGTPINQIYQQSHQGMQHSRTRSQELIANQMNVMGSNTARNYNENMNNLNNPSNSQISNNSIYNNGSNQPGGISQFNQIYENKYHYNQGQSIKNKIERTASTHFSDSIKGIIEQNTILSSSTTANRTGSMISAQQFISSKQKSQIQSNQNLTSNSSKYYNQNVTNSPVSIRKSVLNYPNQNNSGNNNNVQQNQKKQNNRPETALSKTPNMINMFDPNQQSNQQIFNSNQNSSGGQISNINMNNAININNLSNINNATAMQLQQNQITSINNNYNIVNNPDHNSSTNQLPYSNASNQNNFNNYPPSTRINLNTKIQTNHNQIISLSRNNSPSKQKPIADNNHQQQYAPNQISGNSSPLLINSGSQGILPINYQVPQNFIPSQISKNINQNQNIQNNNSSRNASSQRGATKAGSLIKYRQNQ